MAITMIDAATKAATSIKESVKNPTPDLSGEMANGEPYFQVSNQKFSFNFELVQ